jgi:hypothetical protein
MSNIVIDIPGKTITIDDIVIAKVFDMSLDFSISGKPAVRVFRYKTNAAGQICAIDGKPLAISEDYILDSLIVK